MFEGGTALDKDGRPLARRARALPDGEIAAGTPIPGLVPMPALAMAPMPPPVKLVPTLGDRPAGGGDAPVLGYHAELANPEADAGKNPGYPFFIPGEAGHRPPQPPMDFAEEDGQRLDGGLPRHVVVGGTVVYEKHNIVDFTKENITRGPDGRVTEGRLEARALPAEGTEAERTAMRYHARGRHPSSFPDGTNSLPDGTRAVFYTNGGLPRPGAPMPTPPSTPGPRPNATAPSRPASHPIPRTTSPCATRWSRRRSSTRPPTSSSTSSSTRRAGTSRSSASCRSGAT